jgi:hypothetical protein
MTISAQSIILDVQRKLNDETGVRVSARTLVAQLNRAQRDIATARPDTTATTSVFDLEPGPKQSLPSDASLLIDVTANSTGTRERISKVAMVLLDSSEPTWRSRTGTSTIKHFMHDLRTPRNFWVYPPAAAGAQVDLEAARYPTDISAPASPGAEASSVSGNISLGDEWETALFCLVMHYAYLTDLEGAGNQATAAAYLQRATEILGVQIQAATAAAPST